MARKQIFLAAAWSDLWKESYAKLSADRQAACDDAVMALIKQVSSSGLRIKPIQPAKYYLEARINSGDRIVFRLDEGTVLFVDVVPHDDISRYGKRPRA
jgi:mRNA-degrading endonuclease RelE of RelBE toxin-antitoxin system